jgi:hypothetical protein
VGLAERHTAGPTGALTCFPVELLIIVKRRVDGFRCCSIFFITIIVEFIFLHFDSSL